MTNTPVSWLVESFGTANASSAALSRGVLTTTIVPGAANSSYVYLNPVLASIAFVPATGSVNVGGTLSMVNPTTGLTVLVPKDPSGNPILDPYISNFVDATGVPESINITPATNITLQVPQAVNVVNGLFDPAPSPWAVGSVYYNTLAQLTYGGAAANVTIPSAVSATIGTGVPVLFSVSVTGGGITFVPGSTELTSAPADTIYVGYGSNSDSTGSPNGTYPSSFKATDTATPDGVLVVTYPHLTACADGTTLTSVAAVGGGWTFTATPSNPVVAGNCQVLLSFGTTDSLVVNIASTTSSTTILSKKRAK